MFYLIFLILHQLHLQMSTTDHSEFSQDLRSSSAIDAMLIILR